MQLYDIVVLSHGKDSAQQVIRYDMATMVVLA